MPGGDAVAGVEELMTAPHTAQVPGTVIGRMTLDGFASAVRASEGLSIGDLEPLTTLLVRTANSVYHIVIIDRRTIRIHGGRPFPEPSVTAFNGSSDGDGSLKLGWIGVGFRMEVCAGGRRYVTSRVRAITICPPALAAGDSQ